MTQLTFESIKARYENAIAIWNENGRYPDEALTEMVIPMFNQYQQMYQIYPDRPELSSQFLRNMDELVVFMEERVTMDREQEPRKENPVLKSLMNTAYSFLDRLQKF